MLKSQQSPALVQTALLSTSWVKTKANFLPSGQPGQSSGTRSEPGMIGQMSRTRSRSRKANPRRIAVRQIERNEGL